MLFDTVVCLFAGVRQTAAYLFMLVFCFAVDLQVVYCLFSLLVVCLLWRLNLITYRVSFDGCCFFILDGGVFDVVCLCCCRI